LKLSELRVVAFAQFAKKSGKTIVTLRIFLAQVAITLLQLAKDASIVISFKFILHDQRQANCCSETLFWKFSERMLCDTLRHLQSFVVVFIEQVQNIESQNID